MVGTPWPKRTLILRERTLNNFAAERGLVSPTEDRCSGPCWSLPVVRRISGTLAPTHARQQFDGPRDRRRYENAKRRLQADMTPRSGRKKTQASLALVGERSSENQPTRRKLSPEVRRRVMASIRKHDTKPELALRKALWAAGVRGWRCHSKMTGSPDVVFGPHKVAVFVDGVFWHGHPAYLPRGRRGPYWDAKIRGNMLRDRRVNRQLRAEGWIVVRMWDLDVLRAPERAVSKVASALRRRAWSQRRRNVAVVES
jgi:DNA mismatch endonuclease (patch repair protein)